MEVDVYVPNQLRFACDHNLGTSVREVRECLMGMFVQLGFEGDTTSNQGVCLGVSTSIARKPGERNPRCLLVACEHSRLRAASLWTGSAVVTLMFGKGHQHQRQRVERGGAPGSDHHHPRLDD